MKIEVKIYNEDHLEKCREDKQIKDLLFRKNVEKYLNKWKQDIQTEKEKALFYIFQESFIEDEENPEWISNEYSLKKDLLFENASKETALEELQEEFLVFFEKATPHSKENFVVKQYRVELFDKDFRDEVLRLIEEENVYIKTNLKTLQRFFTNRINEDFYLTQLYDYEKIYYFQFKFAQRYDGSKTLKNIGFDYVKDEESMLGKKYIELQPVIEKFKEVI